MLSILKVILCFSGQAGIAFLIITFLKSGIKHQFDRKLEDLKLENSRLMLEIRFQQTQREAAQEIVELLAEWTDSWGNDSSEKRKVLNKLAWKMTLLLPSETVQGLTEIFSMQKNAPHLKEILVQCRKLLKGQDDNLTADQIINF